MTTLLPGLFTAEELLEASYAVEELGANEAQERTKPRASSIARCARDSAYDMVGTPPSDLPNQDHGLDGRSDGKLTAELGRVGEDPTIDAIAALPGTIHVVDRQVCIGHECPTKPGEAPPRVVEPDFWTTGHPDGALCGCADQLHAPEARKLVRGEDGVIRVDPAGLVYGFEHKLWGRFAYKEVLLDGLEGKKPDVVQQATTYGIALGWDAVCVATLAQDSSGIKYEVRDARRKKYKWTAKLEDRVWNPKVTLTWLDLRQLKPMLGPALQVRAEALANAVREYGPAQVQRETDPATARFPCGWCDYKTLCAADGPGIIPVPPPPAGHGW
jgi:hypothetical protein